MEIEIFDIDPEWVVWAKCPNTTCKAVSHACCKTHLMEAINEHIEENH